MYPKPIALEIARLFPDEMECFKDGKCSSVNVVRGPRPFSPGRIEDWMLANEGRVTAVGDYLNFLRRARAHFEKVARGMGYWNASASHRLGHDRWSVGWAAGSANLLSIASYSYVLSSYGITGCILECGVFKGSSTACLSWACNELGLTLYSADSFEGLPSCEGHYAAGDFRGSLDEVRHNVSEFGCIDRVRFISGRYSQSLRHFPHEILLLWIDVDLQQSVVDVMQHVARRLSKSAVIFSDGFATPTDFDGEQVRNTGGEPAGFYRVFSDQSVTYKAVPGGAHGLALIVPQCEEDETVLFSAESFEYLIGRL
jgi:predicted O-methyltransferase YrrM